MSTTEIITEIKKLPLQEQIIIFKKIQESIKGKETLNLKKASELLYEDYMKDKELTSFTSLDSDDFETTEIKNNTEQNKSIRQGLSDAKLKKGHLVG